MDDNVGKMHIMVRKGSIVNMCIANEEKGLLENFDCVLNDDICAYVENQVAPVTLMEKTGDSPL